MKKFLVSSLFIVIFAAYAAYQYVGGASTAYSATAPAAPVTQAVATNNTTSSEPPNPTVATANPSEENSEGAGEAQSETVQQTQPAQPAQTQTTQSTTQAAQQNTQPLGQYKNGTFTGSAENAYYGTVQVQATISGGKLANVTFLQYPNDRSTSRYINSQAMPILVSEAIQAQSAQVNGVSGASDTSAAFVQSLGSALSQA